MRDIRPSPSFFGPQNYTMSQGRTLAATLASKRAHKSSVETQVANPPFLVGVSWVGRAACLLLVSVFAWLRGGVDAYAQVWMGGLLAIGLIAWCVERIFDRSKTVGGLPQVVLPVVLGIFLCLAQLIPLSDGVAGWLAPKQKEIMEAFASPAGMFQSPPTPAARISADADSGRQQIALLVFGLAGLVLGSHFFKSSSHAISLFVVVAINAAFVSIAGLLQRMQFSGQTLLSSELVSGVRPYGTFVNRNNAAGFLLMGLAAALGLTYWSLFNETTTRRPKQLISKEIPVWRQVQQRIGIFIAELTVTRCACLLLCAIIAIGIVATLSRGGVLALLVGGLLTAMTYGIVRDSESRIGWAIMTLAGVVALSLWLGFGAQLAARFDEINDQNAVTTLNRVRNWADTFPAVWEFGVLGSGLGSYHAVHRLYRQDVEERMFESADNQYFQTLVETGWLGFALLITAIAIVVGSAVFVSKKGTSLKTMSIGVTGMFLITSISIASLLDFGVQIPQNCLLMAMLVGMTAFHTHSFAARQKKKSIWRHDLPRWLSWAIAAGVLVGVLLSTRHLWALADLERLEARSPLREDQLSLPRSAAEEQIARLEPLLAKTPTYWGNRRLGELYLHLYRLSRFEGIKDQVGDGPAKLWESTNLVNLYEQMSRLKRIGDRRLIEAYAASPEAEQLIVPAWKALIASRNRLPLQSDVQLMLGQIQYVFGEESKSLICFDRAARTAPTNADFAYIIGLMHLYSERIDEATKYWQRCISLKPNIYFAKILSRVHAMPADRWRIEPEIVMRNVVPRDPALLYSFCSTHLAGEKYASLRTEGIELADELLGDKIQLSDARMVALGIQIKLGLGQKEAALERMKWLVQLAPPNVRIADVRFQMANLMDELGQFDDAYEEIKWLRKNDLPNAKRYSGLFEKLRQRLSKSPSSQ